MTTLSARVPAFAVAIAVFSAGFALVSAQQTAPSQANAPCAAAS